MTSKSYWARRMKMLQEGIIQERAKDVEYIEKQYTKTIKEIEGKIRAWYQRLADNNGVSYAEAQKLLSKNELKDFHMTVEEYIAKGLSGGFEKELENASARVHISRLEALEMELQAHAEELTGKRIARTESAISDAYTESYYHTGYEVQQMAGVGVNMRKVDKKRLENVLARPWAADDKTFPARCWTDKNKLVNILEGELTRMVAAGAAPDKAIKNIADAFNTSKANARRLVLTESAAMASVAEQDCYKELDVEEYEIVGTFDTKMCSDCAGWHGHHFPRKDFKIGVNAPPFHPNCYCVTVPYFDDMAGIGERWMRNPETGKGEWIPSDMSYQDWKDIYVDKKYTLDDWKAKHGSTKQIQKPVSESPKTIKVFGKNQSSSQAYSNMKSMVEKRDIEYNPVKKMQKQATRQEIIGYLGGGDETKGSCASLSFAYAGNVSGYKVLDFRGGSSLSTFSKRGHIKQIANFPNVSSFTATDPSDYGAIKKLLPNFVEGKEYILSVGEHASVVRKLEGGGYEYLELQTVNENGWKKLTNGILKDRFGCKKSHAIYGEKVDGEATLIDVESLGKSSEFIDMLGYINTDTSGQMKGVLGGAK